MESTEKKHIILTPEEKLLLEKPYPAIRCPYNLRLKPGKEYLYCTCGLTKTQPFCDDSHKGTKFEPIKFTHGNVVYASICGCRRNSPEAGPYCDGSHTRPDIEW